MGAGKLPEQIEVRAEEGLRDAEHELHPTIAKLRAQPVTRKIKPEEKNRRRTVSAKAPKSVRTISRKLTLQKLALQKTLKAVLSEIDRIRSSAPTVTIDRWRAGEQIAGLRRRAKALQDDLDQPPNKNRSKKRKR